MVKSSPEKLAQALRANLKRRKQSLPPKPEPAGSQGADQGADSSPAAVTKPPKN